MASPSCLEQDLSLETRNPQLPPFLEDEDYLLRETSPGLGNSKSAECISSYLSVIRLKQFIFGLEPFFMAKKIGTTTLHIFS